MLKVRLRFLSLFSSSDDFRTKALWGIARRILSHNCALYICIFLGQLWAKKEATGT
jgi:hypothetical protein